MKQVDARVQSALKGLSANSNFNVIIEWLTLCRESALKESCRKIDNVESRWLQGEARAFDNILNEYERAKKEIL